MSNKFFSDLRHVNLQDINTRNSGKRNTEVITLDWNQTSSRIAASKTDRSLRVWKLGTERQSLPLVMDNLHERSVEDISWSPLEENILATVGNDKSVKIWNVITGDLTKSIDLDGEKLFKVKYSPDGKYICAITKSNKIVLINASNYSIVQNLQLDVYIYSIEWNNTSSILFVGLATGSINVYSFKSKELSIITELKGHRSSINCIRFDARSRYLVVGSHEGVISIWSLQDLTLLKTIAEVDEPISSIDITFDGSYIGVTFEDTTPFTIYKIEDKEKIHQISKCVSGNQTFATARFHPVRPFTAYSTPSGEVWHTQ